MSKGIADGLLAVSSHLQTPFPRLLLSILSMGLSRISEEKLHVGATSLAGYV